MSAAGFATALLDPDRPPPPGLRAWNDSDPAARFAIYRNNVLSSLVGALAASFPITRALVGADFFAAMASVHVRAAPPRDRRLAQYGADFPAFIETFEPARGLPYLADMARFEVLRVAIYHAGDEPALAPDAFHARLGEDLAALRLRFIPAMAVLRSRFALFSLFAAHEGDLAIGEVDPLQPESVLITRPDDAVIVTRLEPGAAAFLDELAGGATLGEAAFAAITAEPGFDLSTALAALISGGIVAALLSPEDLP
jgi:hypothetical protein